MTIARVVALFYAMVFLNIGLRILGVIAGWQASEIMPFGWDDMALLHTVTAVLIIAGFVAGEKVLRPIQFLSSLFYGLVFLGGVIGYEEVTRLWRMHWHDHLMNALLTIVSVFGMIELDRRPAQSIFKTIA